MKLTVLGTQSPYSVKEHNCPGFLIEHNGTKILLDCGSGVNRMVPFPNILENLHIFITHLHRDHYNDLFNFQYASYVFKNRKRIEKPINIYLPSNPCLIVEDILSEEFSYADYFSISEGKEVKIGDIRVTFCKVEHSCESYAIKLETEGASIVYTGDTSFSSRKQLVEFAKGSRLLLSEASLLRLLGFPEINSHLTAYQAAIIAKEANVGELMLTHFWPEEKVENYINEAKEQFSQVIPAVENQVFEF
jgi:ribonuclease BN (tRNA processing enzyme)